MKKLFTASVSLILPFNRTLNVLQPYKLVCSDRTRYFSKTLISQNTFNEAELNVTNVSQTPKTTKIAWLKPVDETFDEIMDNGSSNDEESNFQQKKRRVKLPDRTINFKTITKSLIEQYPEAERLLASVKNIPFSEPILFEMIRKNPKITTYNPSTVSFNISQLLKLGFNPVEIKKIVRSYPLILEYEGYDIFDSFETWRSSGLFENFLIEFFTQYPFLFSSDNAEVAFRLKRLNYFMMNKINRVTSLLKKNPTIMDGDWNKVEENFKYLYGVMRITEKDMSRSTAFTLPLPFIKLRHSFVEKCGVYIRPKKKEVRGFAVNDNPSLSDIVDTPDETFALNVAKVSPEEYEVFKKIMQYEVSDECNFDEK